jgi:CheY-like chemotaxis protein
MAGERVLAIEHNWQMRKLIRANLEALGLEVKEAVNQHHGLRSLQEGRPDLILLDLDLPDDGAAQLLRSLSLHVQAGPVPIVLLCAEPPGRGILQELQVAGCLLKPFDASSLVRQVCDLLSLSTMQGRD